MRRGAAMEVERKAVGIQFSPSTTWIEQDWIEVSKLSLAVGSVPAGPNVTL